MSAFRKIFDCFRRPLKFDMQGSFMVYLSEKKMMESPWSLRKKGLYQKGPIARGRAIFFYIITLAVGVLTLVSSVSCSHTSSGSGKEATLSSRAPSSEPAETIENSPSPEIEYPKKKYQISGTEHRRLEAENFMLKRENERLSSKLASLNAELAEANRTIYSLNRKLDAIFKPDIAGE